MIHMRVGASAECMYIGWEGGHQISLECLLVHLNVCMSWILQGVLAVKMLYFPRACSAQAHDQYFPFHCQVHSRVS